MLGGRGLSWQDGARPPRSAPATASSTCPAAAPTRCTRSSRSTCSRSAARTRRRERRLPAPRDVVRSAAASSTRCPRAINGVRLQFVREARARPARAAPGARATATDDRQCRGRRGGHRRAPAGRPDAAQPRPRRRLGHDRAPARRGRAGQGVGAGPLPLARGGDLRDSRRRRHARPRRRGDRRPRRARDLAARRRRASRTCSAAGARGLTYLAYGTRERGDICYYPRSNKIAFGGSRRDRAARAARLLGRRGLIPPARARACGRSGALRRAFVVVLDACGVGALPGRRRLRRRRHQHARPPGRRRRAALSCRRSQRLGLGSIVAARGRRRRRRARCCTAASARSGPARTRPPGHWELMGVVRGGGAADVSGRLSRRRSSRCVAAQAAAA